VKKIETKYCKYFNELKVAIAYVSHFIQYKEIWRLHFYIFRQDFPQSLLEQGRCLILVLNQTHHCYYLLSSTGFIHLVTAAISQINRSSGLIKVCKM